MQIVSVPPETVAPSQDFLKEKTILFILECIRKGELDRLPPTPLVRKDAAGRLTAIDGHNLLAVRQYRGESVEVCIVDSVDDRLPEVSEASAERSRELARKFDTVFSEREETAAKGMASFADLVEKYRPLFEGAA